MDNNYQPNYQPSYDNTYQTTTMPPQYVAPPPMAAPAAPAYACPPAYTQPAQPTQEVVMTPINVDVGPDAAKEAEAENFVALMEMNVRKAFLRKVFTLVFLAFGINVICCAVTMAFPENVLNWMIDEVGFIVFCSLVPIIVVIPLFCFRKNPKVALPLFFTFAASYSPLLMLLSAIDSSAVTLAFGALFLIALAITCLAAQPWFNVSFALIGVLAVVVAFPFMWIGLAFGCEAAVVGYCCIGLVLSSLYFMIDVWFAMKVLSIDEYIIAAIQIYLDLLRMLIYLVQIIAASR